MRMEAVRSAWEALPEAPLDAILHGRRPLILAPHPDDESIGCGGLIATACAAGLIPHVVIMTDGCMSHPNSEAFPPWKLRQVREEEALAALKLLGVPHQNVWFLGLPDAAAPRVGPDFQLAARRIASICEAHGCEIILATWRHDPHCDHEATAALAGHVAAREGIPLISYPVWGWTLPDEAEVDEPQPRGWRLDVSAVAALKKQAIEAHASQYGGLITDDPEGFTLPRNLLDPTSASYEVYLAS